MGRGSDVYKLVFVLHLMAVIVGFGGIFWNQLYQSRAAARSGGGGVAVSDANYDTSVRGAEWAIYAVPLLGIFLVLLSGDDITFAQPWISISFVLYVAILGLLHGAYWPSIRRQRELLAGSQGGTASQAGELDRLEGRAALVMGVINALVLVSVAIMVWKPGGPDV